MCESSDESYHRFNEIPSERLILRLIWNNDRGFNLQTADIGARQSAAPG